MVKIRDLLRTITGINNTVKQIQPAIIRGFGRFSATCNIQRTNCFLTVIGSWAWVPIISCQRQCEINPPTEQCPRDKG